MKRIGGDRFEEICSWDNLNQAYKEARRGKSSYREVKWMDRNLDSCLANLKYILENELYKVGEYIVIERVEGGKLRTISKLPFYPDRVIHHAILRVIAKDIRKSYIRDTFQSIPGRGTSDARKRIRRHLKDSSLKFYLQLDLKKYYPSISHPHLKNDLKNKFKCPKILNLLFTIVDSHPGLPIGNYTSQDLGNLHLTSFDWYVKQTLGVKGYFRYCDDLVFFGDSEEYLEDVRANAIKFLNGIGQTVKDSYNLKPLSTGLDFVGYVFYPDGIRLREKIYDSAVEAYLEGFYFPMASYYGWLLPTKHNELKVMYADAIKRKKESSREDRLNRLSLVGRGG